MEKWLIPCNISKYDVIGAFNKLNKIQWKQSSNVNKNDTVFIYLSKPISGIVYKCRVLRVDLPKVTINDRQFILDGSNYEDYGRYMELELIRITLDEAEELWQMQTKAFIDLYEKYLSDTLLT